METAVERACRAARALEAAAAAFAYSTSTQELCLYCFQGKEKAIAPRRSTWARMTIKSLKTKNTAAAGRFQPKMTPLVPKSKWVNPKLSMLLNTWRCYNEVAMSQFWGQKALWWIHATMCAIDVFFFAPRRLLALVSGTEHYQKEDQE